MQNQKYQNRKYENVYNSYKKKLQFIKIALKTVSLMAGFFLTASLLENSFGEDPKKQPRQFQTVMQLEKKGNEKLKIGKLELKNNNKNYSLEVKSRDALQRKNDISQLILTQVEIAMTKQQQGEKFLLKTEEVYYNKLAGLLQIKTAFKSSYGSDIFITGQGAKIILGQGIIDIEKPHIFFDKVTIKANKLQIDYQKKYMSVQQQVEATITDENNEKQKSEIINIKSNYANFYPDEERIVFNGNSNMTGADWYIQAESILFEIDIAKKLGFKNIYAINNSSMKKKGYDFRADHIHYDKLANIIEMQGKAQIKGHEIDIKADNIRYDFNLDKITLISDKQVEDSSSKRVRGSIKDIFDKFENTE